MPRPAGMVPPVSAASTQFIGFRVAAGVAADMRPPRPHLSLARLGTSIDREAAEDLLAGLPLPDTTGIRLDTMALYRRASADAPAGGPRYRIVERHALAPGTGP